MTFEQEPPRAVSAEPLLPQPPRVFTGPFGLRAGWGILLYVMLTVIFVMFCQIATMAAEGRLGKALEQMREHRHNTTPAAKPAAPPAQAAKPSADLKPNMKTNKGVSVKSTLIGEASLTASLVFAAFILAKIERRNIGVYGIGRRRLGDLLPGALCGLVTLSLLVFVLHSGHFLVFDARILFGRDILLSGALWLAAFILVGCFEEYFFRGYFQYTLTRGLFRLAERISPAHSRGVAFLLASILTSLLFFKAHTGNGGETALGLVAVFLAGTVLTYALWRTGSLWWGIGFHMAWDWAQSFLYGVPDSGTLSAGRLFQTHAAGNPLLSGGSAGPEGSVLVIPTLLLILLVLRFTPQGSQPELAPRPVPPHAFAEAEIEAV